MRELWCLGGCRGDKKKVSDIYKFMGTNLEKYALQKRFNFIDSKGHSDFLSFAGMVTGCLGKQETAFSAMGVPRGCYLSPISRSRARSTHLYPN